MGVKTDFRGLRDWMAQRISAVLIAVYIIGLAIVCIGHLDQLSTYDFWSGLMSSALFRWSTALVLFLMVWHAWIGLWTVMTDYVPQRGLQRILLLLVAVLLIGYFAWGVSILWA